METPLINGNYYSFASIECTINGITTADFKSINYNDKLERGVVKGTSAQALGRTMGDYTPTVSVELYRGSFERLKDKLGAGFMQVVFDVTVQYADDGQSVITDTIQGCTIAGVDQSNSQGTDGSSVKLDLSVIKPILWNGTSPIKQIDAKKFGGQ